MRHARSVDAKRTRYARSAFRGNQEIPVAPVMREIAGRRGKAMSDKPLMHAIGKSDDCVIPMRDPNQGGTPSAEGLEGRRSIAAGPLG